jgi:hypothetical protein
VSSCISATFLLRSWFPNVHYTDIIFDFQVTEQIRTRKRKRKGQGTNETTELQRYKLLLSVLATPPLYTTLRINPLVYSKEQIKKRVEVQLLKVCIKAFLQYFGILLENLIF